MYACFIEVGIIGLALSGGALETAAGAAAKVVLELLEAEIKEQSSFVKSKKEAGVQDYSEKILEAIKVGVSLYKNKNAKVFQDLASNTHVSAAIIREFIYNGVHLISNDGQSVLIRWGDNANIGFD